MPLQFNLSLRLQSRRKIEQLILFKHVLNVQYQRTEIFDISLTELSCFSFFKSSLSCQDVFFGKNCSFSSCFKQSQVIILGHLVFISSLIRVLHYNFASPDKNIVVMFTCSSAPILAILKHYSMSRRKFLNSLELFAPPNNFGSSSFGFGWAITPRDTRYYPLQENNLILKNLHFVTYTCRKIHLLPSRPFCHFNSVHKSIIYGLVFVFIYGTQNILKMSLSQIISIPDGIRHQTNNFQNRTNQRSDNTWHKDKISNTILIQHDSLVPHQTQLISQS